MSKYQEEDVRAFLTKLYGKHNIDRLVITDAVKATTLNMIAETKECSELMDYAPRPSGSWGTLIRTIGKYTIGLVFRKAARSEKVYNSCLNTVKNKYRVEILGNR